MLALVVGCAIPLSRLIAGLYAGENNFLTPVLGPVERGFYRLAGVDPEREQDWYAYTIAMVVFSLAGFLSLYALQRLQNFLPLNPRGFDAVAPDLAFNTSTSFITNTNWQNYSGETTMSHLTQMLGLTVHNFLSAATGLAMAFALVRGFARSSANTVGNFWVDVTRVTLYLLLPISVVGALVFVALGMPQTLQGAVDATTLEGVKQTISLGPVASQEIIKELGTNGGGFFNANAAHPFENPNAWTNLLEIWSLLLIATASVLAFGRAVGDTRQGWAILAAMAVFLIRRHRRRLLVGDRRKSNSDRRSASTRLRAIWKARRCASVRRCRSCTQPRPPAPARAAVNKMHDSLTPLAGMVPMFNLLAGCIWPGGVGAGLYGFLVVAIIAVFVAGLMVGRTPEYLGKKIETREMKFAMLAVLLYPLSVLGFTGASVLLQTALDSLGNSGPHGLSEIIYLFASSNANNGSAFAGINGNTLWFNTTGGLVMLLGRFAYVVPVLAMAGSLAAKKKVPASAGTFPTDGPLFVGLLVGVIVILYLLQYFPALALGPVVEHFLMLSGKTY